MPRPFWMAVSVYAVVTAWLLVAATRATDGLLTYALDDTYIHMAVARTLTNTGTWGLRGGEFAGVSSSPLWTLLLACWYAVAGVSELAPLVLNVAAGIAALWFAHRLLARAGWRGEQALWWLAGFALVVPLPTLALMGMEHTLQVALSLWLLDVAGAPRPRPALLAAACAALVACRYEGLFVVLAVATWYGLDRRWRFALAGIGGALLPVVGYAVYASLQGGLWLPTSVLVKAGAPDNMSGLTAWATRLVRRLGSSVWRQPEMALVAAAGVLLAQSPWSAWRGILPLAFGLVALLHAALVPMRVLFRYEAVVVGLGVLAVADCARASGGGRRAHSWLVTAILVCAGCACGLRAFEAIARTPDAARNVYEQQRQMARFLDQLGPARTVAVNDIGAVGFYSRVRVLDLAGLATTDVGRLRMRGAFDTAAIDRVARQHGASVAVLYPDYFTNASSLPVDWIEVQRWRIQNRTSAAYDTVAFYALDAEFAEDLAGRLQRFRLSLPRGVAVLP